MITLHMPLSTRATSLTASRRLMPIWWSSRLMACPPSWAMAASKPMRVRSEDFWKIMARILPWKRG